MKRTPIQRTTRLARGGPIRKKKRTASEYARIYGSRERVAWVKRRSCVACGDSPSENHHIENGGEGRKANAEPQGFASPLDSIIRNHPSDDTSEPAAAPSQESEETT